MAFQSPGFLNQEARDRLALQQQAKELQMKNMQFMVENYNKQKKQSEEMMKDMVTLQQGKERLELIRDKNQAQAQAGFFQNAILASMLKSQGIDISQFNQGNGQPTQRPAGMTAWQVARQNGQQNGQPTQQMAQPTQAQPQGQGLPQQTGQNLLTGVQKSLPPGVSLKLGQFNVTGTDVSTTQQKDINAIRATHSTVDRVIKSSLSVPDIGTGAKGYGKLLSPLPRGLEARARAGVSEFITAGEGGGISGLTKEQDENLRTYISGIPTQGAEVYKAFSGDTGRLSDFDIERGKNLLWRPDLGETIGIRDKKNRINKEAAVEREQAIRQGRFTIDPETGAILTPEVVENAEDKLRGLTTLPPGVTEEDIQYTMQQSGLPREEILRRITQNAS